MDIVDMTKKKKKRKESVGQVLKMYLFLSWEKRRDYFLQQFSV